MIAQQALSVMLHQRHHHCSDYADHTDDDQEEFYSLTHECNGKAPAFVKHPTSSARNAVTASILLVPSEMLFMLIESVSLNRRAMPTIIIVSDAPMIIRVFFAAAELVSSLSLIHISEPTRRTPISYA